jgi:PKD repeat protein
VRRRCALFLVAFALPCLTAATALTAPAQAAVASFTFFPPSPLTGDPVTFDASGSTAAPGATFEWNFDDGGSASGPAVQHSFLFPREYSVRLTVTDSTGTDTRSETVRVGNRDPTASFTFGPASPGTGDTVTFSSTSTDSEGRIASQLWDLDNDGNFDDASGTSTARVFASPGNYAVRLRVTDQDGGSSIAVGTVPVGNRAPFASFVVSPDQPSAGDTVTFFSTSSDPDGPIADQTWDLDGDGSFTDASGPVATRSFTSPGSYTVGLRVVDGNGVAAFASRNFVVLSPAAAAARSLPLLSPFPVVRMVGTVTRRGVRLRRFLVDAPSGAKVTVRCRGRRCPLRKRTRTASTHPSRRAHIARWIRFRSLERRLLRVGVRINVLVTKPGTIGKYTFFRIRRARPPHRIDRCLVPGVRRPTRCPAA